MKLNENIDFKKLKVDSIDEISSFDWFDSWSVSICKYYE